MLKYGVEVICCEIFQFEARGVIFCNHPVCLYVYRYVWYLRLFREPRHLAQQMRYQIILVDVDVTDDLPDSAAVRHRVARRRSLRPCQAAHPARRLARARSAAARPAHAQSRRDK